jgi:hypothetical protein
VHREVKDGGILPKLFFEPPTVEFPPSALADQPAWLGNCAILKDFATAAERFGLDVIRPAELLARVKE